MASSSTESPFVSVSLSILAPCRDQRQHRAWSTRAASFDSTFDDSLCARFLPALSPLSLPGNQLVCFLYYCSVSGEHARIASSHMLQSPSRLDKCHLPLLIREMDAGQKVFFLLLPPQCRISPTLTDPLSRSRSSLMQSPPPSALPSQGMVPHLPLSHPRSESSPLTSLFFVPCPSHV